MKKQNDRRKLKCALDLWRCISRRAKGKVVLDPCNVSSTRQHELSQTSSTGDSLISSEVGYTGWTLSTGFGSESAFRCSAVCTRWLLCRPTADPSPAFLVVATCDRLTAWSSRLATCETCFVRRAFICIRRPFKLELTSCSP